ERPARVLRPRRQRHARRRRGPDARRTPLVVEAAACRPPARPYGVPPGRFTGAMTSRVRSGWLPLLGVVMLLLASPPVGHSIGAAAGAQGKPAAPGSSGYEPPSLAIPDTMRPFLEQVQPGKDAFPLEGQATELEARLG